MTDTPPTNGSTEENDSTSSLGTAKVPSPAPSTADVADEPDGGTPAPTDALHLLAEAQAALQTSVRRLREEHEELEELIAARKRAKSVVETEVDGFNARIADLELQVEEWEDYLAAERKKANGELDRLRVDLDARTKHLDDREGDTARRARDIAKREEKCDSRDATYQDRNATLKEQEQKARLLKKTAETDRDAAAKALSAAEEDQVGARAALHEAHAESARLRAEAEAETQRERAEWVVERETERSDEWDRVRSERAALATDRATLNAAQADLDAQAKDLDAIAEQRAGRKLARARLEVERLRTERDVLVAEAEVLRTDRAEREASRRRTEGRDTDTLDADLQAARRETRSLAAQLQTRPTEAEGDELDRLRRERTAWAAERHELTDELKALKEQKSGQDREAADLAEIREQATFWEKKASATRERFDELSRLVNRDHLSVAPFARCTEVDASQDFQSAPELRTIDPESADVLRHLVDEVHRRLLMRGLRYDPATLRLYLAGLAASRLVLLQGPPGTGKTSLAVAFAEAIGAGHGKIDVQPGWRDKQDLIGHYNPFERRFNETDFLLDLYKSLTPRHVDRPYFVVLDEINLSRPEYYFAEFLGGLEDLAGGRSAWVPLTSRSFDDTSEELSALMGPGGGGTQVPRLAEVDAGTGLRLPIPPNVWFVGTANQDESTLMPAPRTLDRAHVQELPVVRDGRTPSDVPPPAPAGPLGHEDLERAFASAAKRHARQAEDARAFLVSVQDELERLSIGWTPRLLRQVKQFVPVYVASAPEGADLVAATAGAVDHLLVTKTIYKAEGKFTIRKEDLEGLSEHLELAASDRGWSLPRSAAEIARIARAL